MSTSYDDDSRTPPPSYDASFDEVTHSNYDEYSTNVREYGEEFGKTQDVLFGVAYVLAFLVFVVIGAVRWDDTLAGDGELQGKAADWLDQSLLGIWVGITVLAVLFGFGWLIMSRAAAGILIPVCMVGYIVLLVAIALVLVLVGAWIFGLIVLLFAGLYTYFFWNWRHLIGFSAQMLRSATTWVFAHPSTLAAAAAELVVLVVFFIFWIIVLSAPLAGGMESGSEFFLVVYLLFIMYWTTQITKNVLHTSVSGARAATYFVNNPDKGVVAESPLGSALKRSLTSSFGSICFGSLLVAIIKTIRAILRMISNSTDNGFVVMCINCILGYIESLLELFNEYAFVQVSIYGTKYIESAKRTWDLLGSHGVSGIINEVLTGLTFFFGAIMGALVCGGAAALWASSSDSVSGQYSWITALIIGIIIGYVIVAQILQLPDSYVASTFVCLAEEPEHLPLDDPALAQAFREHYGALIPAQAFRDAERALRRQRQRQRQRQR